MLIERPKFPFLKKKQGKTPPPVCSSVLSYIKLTQSFAKSRTRAVDAGGFSSILQGEFSYKTIGSVAFGSEEESRPRNEKLVTKRLAVKKELETVPANKSRLQHEKTVLSYMKNAKNYFLPRYYIATEESNNR